MTFKEFSEAVRTYCNNNNVMDTTDFDVKIEAAYKAYIEADTQEREIAVQYDLLNKTLIKESPMIWISCPDCGAMLFLAKPPRNPDEFQSSFICTSCDLILYSMWTIQQWIDVMGEEVRIDGVI